MQDSINFKSNKLNKYSNILNKNILNKINQDLEFEIKVFYEDYKFNLSYDEFQSCLQKENILSRILSKRIVDSKILKYFALNINLLINQEIHKSSYIINPLIYLRICRKNDNFIDKNSNFYTEPHYDKSENNINFFSVWIPLERTNHKTGTLLYFELEKEIREKYFPYNSKKNTLDMSTYFENHKIFDRILIGKEINVYCEKGDLILFNEKCLHGASKPEKTIRKSINFQIFNKNAIENIDVDNFEKNKLLLFSNIDLINYLDLISFGDKIGADRIKKTKNLSKNLLELFLPYVKDGLPVNNVEYNVNLHWKN